MRRAPRLAGLVIALLMKIPSRIAKRKPRKARDPMAILAEILTFGIADGFTLVAAFCFAAAYALAHILELRIFSASVVFALLLVSALFWVRLSFELSAFASVAPRRTFDHRPPANDR